MRDDLVRIILGRLGVEPLSTDLEGLSALYAAWCRKVPFDNTLKLIHTNEGLAGELPGTASESFFDSWLEHGTGGTCWAGNGALHDLLAALGFDVERAVATMLPTPDVVGPNHGSVVVTIAGRRWITDASILSGDPIPMDYDSRNDEAAGPLPRLVWRDGMPTVLWRTPSAPDGFPCRIERIGADQDEWDVLHQRTVEWSPFNYRLSVRLNRGAVSIGATGGQRFSLRDDGSLKAAPLEQEERVRFLIDEIGISETVAERVPPDRPIPPRP